MSRTLRLALALALILCPAVAWAHAHLKRSEPAGGALVTRSPQVIRLWFTERPELSMTAISLKDENGKIFSLSAVERDRDDPLMVSLRVTELLPPGRYMVGWRSAGSDGHPSRGTFSFVVLAQAPVRANGSVPHVNVGTDTIGGGTATADSSTRSDNEEASEAASSIGNSLARTFSFVGLLVLIGVAAFRTLVLPRTRGINVEMKVRMEQRAAVLGLAASLLVILGALARLSLMSQMMNAMPDMQTMSMSEVAMHTRWGFALKLEVGAALVALVAFALAARGLRVAWLAAGISAIVLAVTPALAGHAAATQGFTSLMIGTDFLHVLGGATWLGSLLTVMVVGVPLALALEGTERWSGVASLVNSFSPIALASAALVVVSGVIASWVHLEHLSALWQTAYGRVLLLKLFLVATTLGIGAYNFRRVQPQLVTELGTARLRRSAAVELSVGFLILLVTGFLTGISP
ncbi:MAG: copper resistance protein CopC/CopD [Anaerolineae bacterium]|nr:copper resistance protein CopC/CopD [Gemmatimonadaceae bacterium]